MKYLLVDGNNLAIRNAFANAQLRTSLGFPTSVHFGFFQSLILLRKKFHEYKFLIAWDSKSERRMAESKLAASNGIVPEAYKENRTKKDKPQPMLDYEAQSPMLKRALEYTGIPQICINGYEADDVIASYVFKLRNNSNDHVMILTSDSDYTQLLSNNVSIFDGMKLVEKTKSSFMEEMTITPEQYVDVGALMGDDSDNIFGVPGCGDVKAYGKIREFGTWQNVVANSKSLMDPFRIKYPDLNTLSDGTEMFKWLVSQKTEKGTQKWRGIDFNMNYTGVAYALENKEKIKIQKLDLMIAMFEKRIELAYSLKKMDSVPYELPEIEETSGNGQKLEEYMRYFEMGSFLKEIAVFDSNYVYKNDDVDAINTYAKTHSMVFDEKDTSNNTSQWDLPF